MEAIGSIFRLRPAVMEAVRLTPVNARAVAGWIRAEPPTGWSFVDPYPDGSLRFSGPEPGSNFGEVAYPGYWIVRIEGAAKKFHVFGPDIFAALFEIGEEAGS
jgi:hypothetical protein